MKNPRKLEAICFKPYFDVEIFYEYDFCFGITVAKLY